MAERDRGLLGLYLADHLAGATAGLARAERMVEAYQDLPIHGGLVQFRDELEQERGRLREVIDQVGTHRRPARQAVAWVGERVGRLKLNRRLTTRSPMTVVLELELFRAAVMGKQGLWQVLQDYSADLGLSPEEFADLARQAAAQRERLEQMHAEVRGSAFR